MFSGDSSNCLIIILTYPPSFHCVLSSQPLVTAAMVLNIQSYEKVHRVIKAMFFHFIVGGSFRTVFSPTDTCSAYYY